MRDLPNELMQPSLLPLDRQVWQQQTFNLSR